MVHPSCVPPIVLLILQAHVKFLFTFFEAYSYNREPKPNKSSFLRKINRIAIKMIANKILFEIDGQVCRLRISAGKRVQNVRNCDVFVDENNFIFYADMECHRFQGKRFRFDVKDMKNLQIKFNTTQREYSCELPCYPEEAEGETIKVNAVVEKGELEKKSPHQTVELWKMRRITDCCSLFVDDSAEPSKFQANFAYGFAGRYFGSLKFSQDDISLICRIVNPSALSPVSRTIEREVDELKDFCRDQYKLNFIELQVPDGHENPMKYITSYDDIALTKDEECNLHNLTRIPTEEPVGSDDRNEVDCGLISILLAICYDLRSTSNEVNCESAWTRTILSGSLSYFERFENMKSVVECFLRRSLIYPLYRNYDLSRLCVQDTVDALQKGTDWILKKLLVTHEIFLSSDYNYEAFNKYFIEDYIRHVRSAECSADHLQMLSRNLKNVLLDINKNHLRLDLAGIETELLKELIDDIHLSTSSESEEGATSEHDASNVPESDGEGVNSETSSSESDAADDGSVIEQKFEDF